MYRLSRGYEKRLRRLDAAIPPAPPTPVEIEHANARRQALYAAALEGQEPPFELTEEEHALLEEAREVVPVYWEMVSEGIITPEGQPGAPAAGHAGSDYEEPIWRT
jgi:hypothetical protein